MPIVDLIAGLLVACALAWGFWVGTGRALMPFGFALGAVVGARLAPQLLTEGHESSFALVFAVTGGLLGGAIVAALFERLSVKLRRRLRRVNLASSIGGAVLTGLAGLAAVWLVAAALVQVDDLRERVGDSTIVSSLGDAVTPPGPKDRPEERPFDSFPIVEGPRPRIGEPDPRVLKKLPVRVADRRVVRISVVSACGAGVGSGWIGADGVVVTNAHVVSASEVVAVKVQGFGQDHPATPIWFDRRNDLALLRVPSLEGTKPLTIVRRPAPETAGAIIGFPLGKHRIGAVRIGRTSSTYRGRIFNTPGAGFPSGLNGRLLTAFRGAALPGNSGGPLVDGQGRVLTTVALTDGDGGGYGVPNRLVRSALRAAGPAVGTGRCRRATTSF